MNSVGTHYTSIFDIFEGGRREGGGGGGRREKGGRVQRRAKKAEPEFVNV
jgi:hypothetical protein